MDYIASLYDVLSGETALTTLLAEHAGGPAIFSGDVVPPAFDIEDKPCILLRPAFAETNRDAFDSFARSVECDVVLYALAGESSADIDEAAGVVRTVLHRQYLSAASGGIEPLCTVSGPFGAPTSDASIAGRRLSARIDLRE